MSSTPPAPQPTSNLIVSHPPTDLICFSHLRWRFVTQRPQHLLTRAARTHRVFYWEEPVWHPEGEIDSSASHVAGARLEIIQEAASLWVVRPHIAEGLDPQTTQRALLDGFLGDFHINQFIRWYYTPMALGFSQHLKAVATVYDCMDELSHFLYAPPELTAHERELFLAADVVFTGGISLYEAKREQHPNVFAFPSSIDVPHFANARRQQPEPADQASIPHPRAGFIGVIDERLDTALLGELARLRPAIHFILIGPVVKIDPATLPQAPNLHYLGSKSYAELPAYLSGWDVALMPFAINEATRFISPTKTPEYLAAGKPVVSSAIRDVVRGYGEEDLVAIATDAEGFSAAIDRALEPPTQRWQQAVEAKLAEGSWDRTWAAMQHEILAAVVRKHARPNSEETDAPEPSLLGA